MTTNKITFVLLFLLASIFLSCKKQGLSLYNTTDNLYFNSENGVYDIGARNTAQITFAYSDETVMDSLVGIIVATTGYPVTYDRAILLQTDSATTAQQHVNFEVQQESLFIRAGLIQDTIYIRLIRTEELKEHSLLLDLRLAPNDYFSTLLVPRKPEIDWGEPPFLPANAYQLYFSDIAITPPAWDDWAFGNFSLKKMDLILELNNKDRSFFLQEPTEQTNLLSKTYSIVLHRYLIAKAEAGETIYEDDGSAMESGGYAQQ